MNEVNFTFSKAIKIIVGVLLVVVVGLSFFIYFSLNQSSPTNLPSGSALNPEASGTAPGSITTLPAVTTTGLSGSPIIKSSPTPGSATVKVSPSKTNLASSPATILAPSANDIWTINLFHTIEWNNPTNIPGGMALANASTKKIVGWIEPHLSPKQTSLSWYTHDIFSSRTSSQKVTLLPGTYVAILKSDQNFADMISSPFTIILGGQQESLTKAIRLIGDTVSPLGLVITKGGKIIFINNNSTLHKITIGGELFQLAAHGGSRLIGTSSYSLGAHNYTSDSFSGQASIIVQ